MSKGRPTDDKTPTTDAAEAPIDAASAADAPSTDVDAWLQPLPEQHLDTRIFLSPRDGHTFFCHWSLEQAFAEAAQEAGGETLVLHLHDVTEVAFDGANASATYAVEVSALVGEQTLVIPRPDRRYVVEIGYRSPGRWFPLARSRPVAAPSLAPSPVTAARYGTVDLDAPAGAAPQPAATPDAAPEAPSAQQLAANPALVAMGDQAAGYAPVPEPVSHTPGSGRPLPDASASGEVAAAPAMPGSGRPAVPGSVISAVPGSGRPAIPGSVMSAVPGSGRPGVAGSIAALPGVDWTAGHTPASAHPLAPAWTGGVSWDGGANISRPNVAPTGGRPAVSQPFIPSVAGSGAPIPMPPVSTPGPASFIPGTRGSVTSAPVMPTPVAVPTPTPLPAAAPRATPDAPAASSDDGTTPDPEPDPVTTEPIRRGPVGLAPLPPTALGRLVARASALLEGANAVIPATDVAERLLSVATDIAERVKRYRRRRR